MRSIEEVNARDYADVRLAVYAGNLKRGAQIRELRTSKQVTQTEMADELSEVFGEYGVGHVKHVAWSVFSVSVAERGITAMSDRTFFAYKAAINKAASYDSAKERRKLKRRSERSALEHATG